MIPRIETLLELPIVGNAYSDRGILDLADAIICDENEKTQDRIKAMKRLDEICGVSGDDVTADDIIEYTRCASNDDWSSYKK